MRTQEPESSSQGVIGSSNLNFGSNLYGGRGGCACGGCVPQTPAFWGIPSSLVGRPLHTDHARFQKLMEGLWQLV